MRGRRRRSWQRRRSSRSRSILPCDLSSFYFMMSVCLMKREIMEREGLGGRLKCERGSTQWKKGE